MKKVLISTALLSSMMMFAGGFRVSLQGVRQLAMAHTSAHAEDASVAFFNPAGISFIPSKISVAVGGFGAMSKLTYQNPTTLESYHTDNPVGTPLYFAVAGKINDVVSIGLSVATPFGNTIEWPDNWSGKDIVQRLELKAFYFQPMISFKMAPWASFGASYIYARGGVDWTKGATNPFNGTVNLKDDKATGQGFGFGFYMQPDEKWDVSIAYRSPVDMKAKNGKVTMTIPASSASQQIFYSSLGLDANGQDDFTATLPLVEEFTLGATYKVTPKWLISADFNYHGWERYSKLTLDFANAKIGNQADPTVSVSEKNWRNTKTFRVGTQYMINSWIAGRLGWYYDESPYEDKYFVPESPSFDAHVITGGLGFKFNKFGIDIAAAQSFPKARQFNNQIISFAGQAKATSTYFGLGISYNVK